MRTDEIIGDSDTQRIKHSLTSNEKSWTLLTLVAVAVVGLIWFITQFYPRPDVRQSYLAFFQDDAFYYFKIADNLAQGKGSTFDGIVPTNGYHPLWLLVVTSMRMAVQGETFFVLVSLVSLLAIGIASVLAFQMLGRMGYPNHIWKLTAVAIFAFAFIREAKGMEDVLAIPLLLAFVVCILAYSERPSWGRALATGAFALLSILSRLDSALLIACVVSVWMVLERSRLGLRTMMRLLAALAISSIPCLFYLGHNYNEFGSVLPVSGQAKHLRDVAGFSGRTWESIHHRLIDLHPSFTFVAMMVMVAMSVARIRFLPTAERIVICGLAGFSLLHYTMLSWSSDWQLWPWYHYGVLIVTPVSIYVLLRGVSGRIPVPPVAVLCLVLAAMIGISATRLLARRSYHDAFYQSALRTADFMNSHPGRYAMGDRAGMPAFLSTQPIIQVEGLVADRWMIDAIRRHADLQEVFSHYGVEYYVATNPARVGNCYRAEEPRLAGPRAPHMRGVLCEEPLFVFDEGEWRTVIFRVRRTI